MPPKALSVLLILPHHEKKETDCNSFYLQSSQGYLWTNPIILLVFARSSCFASFLEVSLRKKELLFISVSLAFWLASCSSNAEPEIQNILFMHMVTSAITQNDLPF